MAVRCAVDGFNPEELRGAIRVREKILRKLAALKPELQARFSVREISLFGSFVRGEEEETSDIDILVEYTETPDMFEFLDLEEYLSTILGIKVDLVTKGALKPYIGKRILEEVVYL